MTEHDAITRAFTDLAARYELAVDAELRRFWGYSYEGFLDWLISLIPIEGCGVILDLATGTALLPRRLVARAQGLDRVIGLDITLGMVEQARVLVDAEENGPAIELVCASAMAIPLAGESVDIAICALGTHHMDAWELVGEIKRVLKSGGSLIIADVAASPLWRLPGVRTLLRVLAYLYFALEQGSARAWAEAAAVSHVRTIDEWREILSQHDLADVRVVLPKGSRFWSPAPFAVNATKVPQCADGGGGC